MKRAVDAHVANAKKSSGFYRCDVQLDYTPNEYDVIALLRHIICKNNKLGILLSVRVVCLPYNWGSYRRVGRGAKHGRPRTWVLQNIPIVAINKQPNTAFDQDFLAMGWGGVDACKSMIVRSNQNS